MEPQSFPTGPSLVCGDIRFTKGAWSQASSFYILPPSGLKYFLLRLIGG